MADVLSASALTDNFANPTVPLRGSFIMGWDGATWDRLPGTAADGLLVNLGTNNDVTVTGTVTANAGTNLNTSALALETGGNLDSIATDLGTIAAAVATEGSALSSGVLIKGDDGTDRTNVLVDTDGHLQVDVLTGGGTDTPANPVNAYVTSASLAVSSAADLTTPEAASKKLAQVEVWSSQAFRARLYTVDDAVESTDPFAVGGGDAYQPFIWKPPHRDYVQLGANAGLDAFRAEVTNLGGAAADVYATFHYED